MSRRLISTSSPPPRGCLRLCPAISSAWWGWRDFPPGSFEQPRTQLFRSEADVQVGSVQPRYSSLDIAELKHRRTVKQLYWIFRGYEYSLWAVYRSVYDRLEPVKSLPRGWFMMSMEVSISAVYRLV